MVTLDLNTPVQPDDLFLKLKAGEELRVIKGHEEIILVPKRELSEEEESDAWAAEGLRQLTETCEPGEFDNWKRPDGTR